MDSEYTNEYNEYTSIEKAKNLIDLEETDERYYSVLFYILRSMVNYPFKKSVRYILGKMRGSGHKTSIDHIISKFKDMADGDSGFEHYGEQNMPSSRDMNKGIKSMTAIFERFRKKQEPVSSFMNLFWIETYVYFQKEHKPINAVTFFRYIDKLKNKLIDNSKG